MWFSDSTLRRLCLADLVPSAVRRPPSRCLTLLAAAIAVFLASAGAFAVLAGAGAFAATALCRRNWDWLLKHVMRCSSPLPADMRGSPPPRCEVDPPLPTPLAPAATAGEERSGASMVAASTPRTAPLVSTVPTSLPMTVVSAESDAQATEEVSREEGPKEYDGRAAPVASAATAIQCSSMPPAGMRRTSVPACVKEPLLPMPLATVMAVGEERCGPCMAVVSTPIAAPLQLLAPTAMPMRVISVAADAKATEPVSGEEVLEEHEGIVAPTLSTATATQHVELLSPTSSIPTPLTSPPPKGPTKRCVVCLERPRAVQQACGHFALCERCFAKTLLCDASCPLCRAPLARLPLTSATGAAAAARDDFEMTFQKPPAIMGAATAPVLEKGRFAGCQRSDLLPWRAERGGGRRAGPEGLDDDIPRGWRRRPVEVTLEDFRRLRQLEACIFSHVLGVCAISTKAVAGSRMVVQVAEEPMAATLAAAVRRLPAPLKLAPKRLVPAHSGAGRPGRSCTHQALEQPVPPPAEIGLLCVLAADVLRGLAHLHGLWPNRPFGLTPKTCALAAGGVMKLSCVADSTEVQMEQALRPDEVDYSIYMGPEVLGAERRGSAADVWSLGLLVLQFVCNCRLLPTNANFADMCAFMEQADAGPLLKELDGIDGMVANYGEDGNDREAPATVLRALLQGALMRDPAARPVPGALLVTSPGLARAVTDDERRSLEAWLVSA